MRGEDPRYREAEDAIGSWALATMLIIAVTIVTAIAIAIFTGNLKNNNPQNAKTTIELPKAK